MAIKSIDPEDMYVVRLMFGCGHGHAMPPGFTHWESGEGCPWDHSEPGPMDNESMHLYGRLLAVPIVDSKGEDMWAKLCGEPNVFGQFPLAPEGLKEGQHIGETVKIRKGAKLSKKVKALYNLKGVRIVHYDPSQD